MKIPIKFLSTIAFCFLFMTIQSCSSQSKPIIKGDLAPSFKAEASLDGKEVDFSLEKALQKGPVVLYFFPSAYTSGCDIEAHAFAIQKLQFERAGATIIGISADDINRLNEFSADPDYCAGAFLVASDANGVIAESYGLKMSDIVEGAKDVRGKEINHGFIERTTFVIGKDGKIAAVLSSEKDGITPQAHVKKSLALVKKM